MKKLSRREFLGKAFNAGIALTTVELLFSTFSKTVFAQSKKKLPPFPPPSPGKNLKTPDIAVVVSNDPEKNTRKAVELLGGMKKFVKQGDVVVVKPNIGWDRKPEFGANTNPVVVATLVKLAYEAGAKKVKVFDRSCDNARRCYASSGIEKAARDAGAEVKFIEDSTNYVDTVINGVSLKNWPVSKDILECDCFINVPVAKQHGSSKFTLSMKNLMGVLGGNRGSFHVGNLHRWIADLAATIKPKLVVIDAMRVLFKSGPTGGNLEDVWQKNTIIASPNPVSADSYACSLFNRKGENIDHIKFAYEMGLGEMDISKLKVHEINL
ncbi:MAG: hypothetical protein A3J83_05565 [Elusimicrobia bacterium RIFOXYA2_FULL_40_6]|nr:MAG: hypothetical protein A3J83_05565 [Elusimicrobia bacterium RIFOXYA2_FULL_40_6]